MYSHRWQQSRKVFLDKNPLCVFCKEYGIVKEAEVVDHIKPHKGDWKLFWDVDNWQSLCKQCHDSTKQRMEKSGLKRIGADGWPIEEGVR